jgi:hypothetical protein
MWIIDYNLDVEHRYIEWESNIECCGSCEFEKWSIPEIEIKDACCCIHRAEYTSKCILEKCYVNTQTKLKR